MGGELIAEGRSGNLALARCTAMASKGRASEIAPLPSASVFVTVKCGVLLQMFLKAVVRVAVVVLALVALPLSGREEGGFTRV